MGKGLRPVGKSDLRRRDSLSIAEPRELLVRHSVNAAYLPDGRVAKDTLRAWGPGPDAFDSVPNSFNFHSEDEELLTYDEDVIWAGLARRHYGHFLTEATARLWPLTTCQPLEGVPAVFSQLTTEQFARDWVSALGVRVIDIPEDGIARFTRMHVPEPSLRLRAWLAPELRDTHLQARRGLRVELMPPKGVVWLSRSSLDLNFRAAYDECLLEWLLREHVEIVSPETMTLANQIATLEASTAIAGILGSAFYTLLMVEEPPISVGLSPPRFSSTYFDMAHLLGGKIKLVQGLTHLAPNPHHPEALQGGFQLLVPEILRRLGASILPKLSDDPLLATLAHPQMLVTFARRNSSHDLDTAIARVVLDPHSASRRIRLARIFESEGVPRQALEQYAIAAHLADDCIDEAIRSAQRVEAAEMGDAASPTTKRILLEFRRSR